MANEEKDLTQKFEIDKSKGPSEIEFKGVNAPTRRLQDLTQKFDDWIKKSPDIMALKWLRSQINELREHKHPEIIGKKEIYNLDFINKNIEDVLREIFVRFPRYNDSDVTRNFLKKLDDWKFEIMILIKEKFEGKKEHWTDKSKIMQTLIQDSDSKKDFVRERLHGLASLIQENMRGKKKDDYRFKKEYTQEVLDSKIKEALNESRECDIDLDDAQAIGYEKGINKGKKLQKEYFVKKIESMRVKFADATKNYTTMDLMNELWEYKRELEKKVK